MAAQDNRDQMFMRKMQQSSTATGTPDGKPDTWFDSEPSTSAPFPPALATTDVRTATAGGGYHECNHTPTTAISLPRPGASAASPARLSGADLLRILQERAPPPPPPPPPPVHHFLQQQSPEHTSTTKHWQRWHSQQLEQHHANRQQWHKHDTPQPQPSVASHHYAGQQHHDNKQQQEQQQEEQQEHRQALSSPLPPPNFSISRRLAAEQERFLKNCLSIRGDSSGDTNMSVTPPPCPQSSCAQLTRCTPTTQTEVTHATSAEHVSVDGDGEDKSRKGKRRGRDRAKGRGQRGRGRGVGGGGGGGEDSLDTEVITASPSSERTKRPNSTQRRHGEHAARGRGKGRGARNQSDSSGRGGRTGGRAGGSGARGRAAVSSPPAKYAWSAFQNSPDPKSIPLPPLSHFSLDADVSMGEGTSAVGSASVHVREGMLLPYSGEEGQETGLKTPPRQPHPPDGVPPSEGERRSTAKRKEDDIKRMLRLG